MQEELTLEEQYEADLEARVMRGVQWLDENVPLWEAKVEIQDLKMESTCRCVLGFVFAEEAYEHPLSSFSDDGYGYAQEVIGLTGPQAVDMGFDVKGPNEENIGTQWYYDQIGKEYEDLGDLWKQQIQRRMHA